MLTNIDTDGNYPLPDTFEFLESRYFNIQSFTDMWKEEIQFYPEISHNKKVLEFCKKLTEKVYDSVMDKVHFELADKIILHNDVVDDCMQNIANQAYEDGVKDTKEKDFNKGYKHALELCTQAINELR